MKEIALVILLFTLANDGDIGVTKVTMGYYQDFQTCVGHALEIATAIKLAEANTLHYGTSRLSNAYCEER